ncbi:hypothetical protein C0099_06660 [Pseudazoarcus pumilus]|uniref:DUF5679 domain-containing protein n=1 Tax=Pseudazoarcus pumilus TaxID=2067960 RepID=A0A2I6S5X1_9RHOO|nr:hypothetical protein C0099_06660 [Pseudazoarcus pumilus]
MAVESLPNFTPMARRHWTSIPAGVRQKLLSNVWCGECRAEVTITEFRGRVDQGDLLLEGKCSECGAEVARVIEAG